MNEVPMYLTLAFLLLAGSPPLHAPSTFCGWLAPEASPDLIAPSIPEEYDFGVS
jgi:hypothetical protein